MPNEPLKSLVPTSTTNAPDTAVPSSPGPDTGSTGEASTSPRDSSTVERGAHIPEAAGSNPAPATSSVGRDRVPAAPKEKPTAKAAPVHDPISSGPKFQKHEGSPDVVEPTKRKRKKKTKRGFSLLRFLTARDA